MGQYTAITGQNLVNLRRFAEAGYGCGTRNARQADKKKYVKHGTKTYPDAMR
jgi:hypothetical protein